MNVAKIILWAILLVLAVIIFFSFTGINPRQPLPGIQRLLGQVAGLGQSLNNFFSRLADNFMRNLRNIPNP